MSGGDHNCRGLAFDTQKEAEAAMSAEREKAHPLARQPRTYVCLDGHFHFRVDGTEAADAPRATVDAAEVSR